MYWWWCCSLLIFHPDILFIMYMGIAFKVSRTTIQCCRSLGIVYSLSTQTRLHIPHTHFLILSFSLSFSHSLSLSRSLTHKHNLATSTDVLTWLRWAQRSHFLSLWIWLFDVRWESLRTIIHPILRLNTHRYLSQCFALLFLLLLLLALLILSALFECIFMSMQYPEQTHLYSIFLRQPHQNTNKQNIRHMNGIYELLTTTRA